MSRTDAEGILRGQQEVSATPHPDIACPAPSTNPLHNTLTGNGRQKPAPDSRECAVPLITNNDDGTAVSIFIRLFLCFCFNYPIQKYKQTDIDSLSVIKWDREHLSKRTLCFSKTESKSLCIFRH